MPALQINIDFDKYHANTYEICNNLTQKIALSLDGSFEKK